jgi:hypothetical protein
MDKWSVSSRSLYLRKKVPLGRRLSGSQSRSGRRGERKKKALTPAENRTPIPQSSSQQPITIPSELSWLPSLHRMQNRVLQSEVVKLLHRPHACNFSYTSKKFHITSVGVFAIYFQGKYYIPSYDGWLAKTKLNSVVLVRKRTIPTERPPLSAK